MMFSKCLEWRQVCSKWLVNTFFKNKNFNFVTILPGVSSNSVLSPFHFFFFFGGDGSGGYSLEISCFRNEFELKKIEI